VSWMDAILFQTFSLCLGEYTPIFDSSIILMIQSPPSRQKRFRIPDSVRAAHSEFEQARKALYHQHRRFAHQLCIDKASVATHDNYLSAIPTITLPRLDSEYPPHLYDVCETEDIQTLWTDYCHNKKHPDLREARHHGGSWPKTMVLDETELQKVVGVDESAVFKDVDTGEIVAVVLRNVCGEQGVLDWVTDVIYENVGWHRNVRVSTLCLLACH